LLLRGLDALGNLHGIAGKDPKQYPAGFCVLIACCDFLQQVMIFFVTKTSFQNGGPGPVQYLS